ncbi:uncharacterized protein KQ657_002993 [Scheffersomyces spartinae]|uniref:RGS domain-containing protein n=1 Tax=Scheffersomyces spartinae TaxID=45513 RepID=A0A9P7V581_9ASCO|nr:uncharacterized protein KQ657_002993 [Scheffersomyces spartinae]KAG7191598.1 hypothetical protein KQ657_002993 [Scheffersomyces spartinae]
MLKCSLEPEDNPSPPSLDTLIANDLSTPLPPAFSRSRFVEYLSGCHALENFEFIVALVRFCIHSRSDIGVWRLIYNNFIAVDLTREVNIPCEVRNRFEPHQIPHDDDLHLVKMAVYDILLDSYNDFVRVTKRQMGYPYTSTSISSPPPADTIGSPIHRRSSDYVAPDVPLAPVPRPVLNSQWHTFPDIPLLSESHSVHITHYASELDANPPHVAPRSASTPGPTHHLVNGGPTLSPYGGATTPSSTPFGSGSEDTPASSRGSLLGSIMENLKAGELTSWKKAVKKFKLRRFSNDY